MKAITKALLRSSLLVSLTALSLAGCLIHETEPTQEMEGYETEEGELKPGFQSDGPFGGENAVVDHTPRVQNIKIQPSGWDLEEFIECCQEQEGCYVKEYTYNQETDTHHVDCNCEGAARPDDNGSNEKAAEMAVMMCFEEAVKN